MRQEKNRETKSSNIWPSEGVSEVKHPKLGPFPHPHTGATHISEHDSNSDVGMESSRTLVPTSIVLKKTQDRTSLLNKAGASNSCLPPKATGGSVLDRLDEFDVPQSTDSSKRCSPLYMMISMTQHLS